jgi:hypothetical protein
MTRFQQVALISVSSFANILAGRVRVLNWPQGATVKCVAFDARTDDFLLLLEHPLFSAVPENAPAPELILQCELLPLGIAAPE